MCGGLDCLQPCSKRPKHTATHWLQHAATHCNTLQHTATHYNSLQLQHAATHCNTLQHAATRCNTLQHPSTRCYPARAADDSAASLPPAPLFRWSLFTFVGLFCISLLTHVAYLSDDISLFCGFLLRHGGVSRLF